ncbi:hypothetical protein DERP_010144 [Dermatophagoides pteronyssinus]|uniref:Uncharacterized protein n=1 Tax=Dermatophagoides pteronyssinus TaxID=6956 RepID=A0ABQ8J6W4_DERPT|nr:hypothetical protein DERP_010144 [Dermatophagoides pteronyssinus]
MANSSNNNNNNDSLPTTSTPTTAATATTATATKQQQPSFLRQMSNVITQDQIWIDPYTNERIWILNPMHIVHLSKQQKSRFIRLVEGFKKFKAPMEDLAKKPINKMRERIIKELWWNSKNFHKVMAMLYRKQMQVSVASIIYAFIGIPLLLMVLTDLGKLFTRGIKFIFKIFRRIYYTRQLQKCVKQLKNVHSLYRKKIDDVHRKMSTVVPLNKNKIGNNESGLRPTDADDGDNETIPDFEVDDEFNLPISVAVVLLLLYMMMGAAIFTIWEKMDIF